MSIFEDIADIAFSARKRKIQEYADFMEFYKGLVESLPEDVVGLFGKMNVAVIQGGSHATWGILLTATDYIFWKNAFADRSVRFAKGPSAVKRLMHERLAEKVEREGLSAEERKKLLFLLESMD